MRGNMRERRVGRLERGRAVVKEDRGGEGKGG